ncbi:MAG: metalloregulator ArsR/SmtB family transcription factor [Lapillicoccus sp.]
MSLEDEPTVSARGDVHRLRALAHPVRLEMLSLLTGTAMSAAEVARELDLTQANASYHLRLLRDAGLLVIAGEEKVNGGVAKRYRHLWDQPQPGVGPGSPDDVDAVVRTLSDAVSLRLPRRVREERGHFTDADLWVEPAVWDQVTNLLTEASRLMHAEAKPPHAEGTVRGNLSILAFRLQDQP